MFAVQAVELLILLVFVFLHLLSVVAVNKMFHNIKMIFKKIKLHLNEISSRTKMRCTNELQTMITNSVVWMK